MGGILRKKSTIIGDSCGNAYARAGLVDHDL